MLYKLKTSKLFDEVGRGRVAVDDDDDCPFAVHRMHVCVDSRLLCVAGNCHVLLFHYSKLDASIDCPVSRHVARSIVIDLRQRRRYMFLPLFVCLSVC